MTRMKATVRRYSRSNLTRKYVLVIQVITPAITRTKTTAQKLSQQNIIYQDTADGKDK
jgi:hypothetical protein